MLTDAQWLRIADLLPGKATDKGRTAADNRRFVEAVLHIARTGCPWRDMPKEFGNWHSTYVRFARWEAGGVWNRIALSLQGEVDLKSCSSMPRLFVPISTRPAHEKKRLCLN